MCELYGLSSNRARTGRASALPDFRVRGGGNADNPDGWGVAWSDMGAFRLEKAPEPAFRSQTFDQLIDHLRSDLIIAHVRKARFPPVNTSRNTHPFLRACCGRIWAFAHNGLVPAVVALEASNNDRVCEPEGETDSEFAFCHLLSHATRHFATTTDDWPTMLGAVSALIARHGQFNFLLSDGEHLIAYGHDRLHYRETTGVEHTVEVATEPLCGRPDWIPFARGELRIWRAGALVRHIPTQLSDRALP
ncbi:MAG: class II glutamine amidotransferase [Thiotrichales bacterium]